MKKEELKTQYFDNIKITQEEINSGYFKSKWYKYFDSEKEYLDKNQRVIKIRDGVYTFA